jgi:hypothetical protein
MPKYKDLDKDMLRMMTITERFNYMNQLKQIMVMGKDPNEKEPNQTEWVDRDDDGGYDNISDGKGNGRKEYNDDDFEY